MIQGNRGPELMIRICLRGPVPAVNGIYDRHNRVFCPYALRTAVEREMFGVAETTAGASNRPAA